MRDGHCCRPRPRNITAGVATLWDKAGHRLFGYVSGQYGSCPSFYKACYIYYLTIFKNKFDLTVICITQILLIMPLQRNKFCEHISKRFWYEKLKIFKTSRGQKSWVFKDLWTTCQKVLQNCRFDFLVYVLVAGNPNWGKRPRALPRNLRRITSSWSCFHFTVRSIWTIIIFSGRLHYTRVGYRWRPLFILMSIGNVRENKFLILDQFVKDM